MRTPPANWTTLMAQPHTTETRVDIDGVSYYGFDGDSGVWSLETGASLFEKISVGNCHSGQINLVLVNPYTIPTMAKMEVYVRITNGTLTTSWVRKGVYFIDTREWDAQHEFLTITGYDAMLKAEQEYAKLTEITQWGAPMRTVVNEIADIIGVDVKNASAISNTYTVDYPNDLTMRSVLGYIAAAHGGNFYIDDDGELRFVPIVSSYTVTVGTNAIDLKTSPAYQPFGKVIVYTDEESAYAAQVTDYDPDTHRTLEIDCEWGTQAIANAVLNTVKYFAYQPLEITTAFTADPLWELGDGVLVDEYVGQIITQDTLFSRVFSVNISSPDDAEINHEYPYEDATTRSLKKVVKLNTRYYGTRISRENGLEIVNTDGSSESTRVKLNSDELIFYDAAGSRALYFDPVLGKYMFIGDVQVLDGSIYGTKIFAGTPGESKGWVQMTPQGFDVYNPSGVLKAKLGYTTGLTDYPFLQLGAGSDVPGTKGTIKKFRNGLWLGNDVVENDDGTFSPKEGCHGIFCDFEAGEVYVVNDTDAVEIFIGQTVARFG